MVTVAITMDDGSVRRMQCVSDELIEASIKKTPWADQVASWRPANMKEFPVGCTWRDEGGKIVGDPIIVEPVRDFGAEIDVMKTEIGMKADK